jgi:hypothetical protein
MDRVREHALPLSLGFFTGIVAGFGISRLLARGKATGATTATAAATPARSGGRKKIGVLPP